MTVREAGPRLGRGLAALLGEAALQTDNASSGLREIPLDLLEPGPFQPRGGMDHEALAELADSIRARGILQPLLARPHPNASGRFQIIAGERRWRAAALAGMHEAPTLIRELTDIDAAAAALVENLQRQDLNPIEEAEGYNRLLDDFGMTQEVLARSVGKSRPHISNTLRLLNLPALVLLAVRDGTVTAGHARALLAHPSPEQALKTVLAKGLSVRQTEALATSRKQEPSPDRLSKDTDTRALEHEISGHLGLRAEIVGEGRRGMVRIYYRDLEQFEGLLTKLRAS